MNSLGLEDYVIRSENFKNSKGCSLVELLKSWDIKLAKKRKKKIMDIELNEKYKLIKYLEN